MRERIARLVLIALLVRAVVPAGFMVAYAAEGAQGLTVVICTEHGQKTIAVDESDDDQSNTKASHATCPFAASALAGYVSATTELVGSVAYASVVYRLARIQFSLTPQPGATSARGPPGLV